MSSGLRLDRLAVHYVDRNAEEPVYATGEQNVVVLHPTIVGFLMNLVDEIWDAPDSGSTRSGLFVLDDHERLRPSFVKRWADEIAVAGDPESDRFFATSKALAEHLHQQSHPRASAGLLAVMRLTSSDSCFVALIKIRHRDESFVHVLSDALTQLDVEQVQNMLLPNIQKGVIIPHPVRSEYHLKVIDKQASEDPAQYFVEDFLGCITKKSDEHQVKKLLSELQSYAHDRDLPLAIEKLPQVVTCLQEKETDIDTPMVAEVAQEQEVFGPDFQPDDLTHYITSESDLGPVDIPRQRFSRRGKTGQRPRRLTYRFRDPHLRGVVLTGPAETLRRLTQADGDIFTVQIETSRNSIDIDYG